MQSTTDTALRPAPSTAHLLDTPLPDLLTEFRVDVSELQVDEPKFTGGTYIRPDGTMLFAMPAGQNRWEREMVARSMLGQALHVQMPPLPAPYQLTELAPSGA